MVKESIFPALVPSNWTFVRLARDVTRRLERKLISRLPSAPVLVLVRHLRRCATLIARKPETGGEGRQKGIKGLVGLGWELGESFQKIWGCWERAGSTESWAWKQREKTKFLLSYPCSVAWWLVLKSTWNETAVLGGVFFITIMNSRVEDPCRISIRDEASPLFTDVYPRTCYF